ncbi:MAG: DUF2029 domain-containing protein [Rhodococcus sp.]|nr:DUF2029 domain-containing protein [Rhodococcus sp. (in: high G+C Gram-positive bacteria)]
MVLLVVTVRPWTPDIGILRGGMDLFVYRDGSWIIQNGFPLYTAPITSGLLYTYTPFSALVFIPIEKIPPAWSLGVWLAINVAVLIAVVALCWRLLGYRLTPYLLVVSAAIAAGCMFLEPVRTTLFYGQINLVLMLLVVWDFSRAPRAKLRGVGVGIAAGIKLTPAYFVAVFAVVGQWRSAVVATVTFAATIAGAWLILPSDSRQYWTETFFNSERIAPDGHPSNQSVRGVIAHLTGAAAPVWLWLAVAIPVFVVSMVIVAAAYRSGDRLLALSIAGLTSPMVSPFSWSHHWVWFVPFLVYLVDRAFRNPRWWLAIGVVFTAAAAWPYRWSEESVVIGLFLFPPDWAIAQVLMNLFPLVYVVILVWAGIGLWRSRSSGGPEKTLPGEAADIPDATTTAVTHVNPVTKPV